MVEHDYMRTSELAQARPRTAVDPRVSIHSAAAPEPEQQGTAVLYR